jgi:putative SOS response-associated peptidase YedK
MCGRFTLYKADDGTIKKKYSLTKITFKLAPRRNISPQEDIPVILNDTPDTLSLARWGFIPHWAKDGYDVHAMINARAETLAEKPFFRDSARSRRCIIPADGFYEWQAAAGGKGRKVPYKIAMKDGGLFSFAGVWDLWEKEGQRLVSCAIITTEANSLVKKIHDRMPVILPDGSEKAWLGSYDAKLLKPFDPDMMKAEVSDLDE